MKRFESGDALAKEIGVSSDVLKKTFDDYNTSARTKKDPFGKKVCVFSSVIVESLADPCSASSSSPTASGP
jgi:hypothetical protein